MFFCFFSGGMCAQIKVREVKKDIGIVYSPDNGGAYYDFVFENSSDKPHYILRSQNTPKASVLFSSKRIEPKGSIYVRIKYISLQEGRFLVNVPVFVSAQSDPIVLSLSGETKYKDTKTSQACPSFSSKSYKEKKEAQITLRVIDAVSKKPIADAMITISNSPWSKRNVKSDASGTHKAKSKTMGIHFFDIQKSGYLPLSTKRTISFGSNVFVFELEPQQVIPPLKEELIIQVKDKKTFAAIASAQVRIKDKKAPIFVQKTSERGQVLFMDYTSDKYYSIDVSAENYQPRTDYQLSVFDKKDNLVTIYLNAIEKEEPVVSYPPQKPKDKQPPTQETPKTESITPLSSDKYAPNNIVFLIDKSSSMKHQERFDILKTTIIELLKPLRKSDKIALITYDTEVDVLLPSTQADHKALIADVVFELEAEGLTAGVSGVEKAFDILNGSKIKNGNNELFVITDGAFNVGGKQSMVEPRIKKEANNGFKMSVIGIKTPMVIEDGLKKMAQIGNGEFITIDSSQEAKTKLLDVVKAHSRK